MLVSTREIKDAINLEPVAYTPRILCGIATAISILAFTAIFTTVNPTIAFQLKCLCVSLYSAVTAAALLGIAIIRDILGATFLFLETDRNVSEKLLTNIAYSIASPFIAGGLVLWSFLDKK